MASKYLSSVVDAKHESVNNSKINKINAMQK